MKYTINQFHSQFPSEESCLDYVFNKKYGSVCSCKKGKLYKVSGRKCWACSVCAKQVHPLAGTIFEKSSTSLKDWFFAIYLFSISKNGVSAKELQRQLGVTYKTAWRMARQIRHLMTDGDILGGGSGEVEVDETYIGGRKYHAQGGKGKAVVIGMVERQGGIRAKHVPTREAHVVLETIRKNVSKGSRLMTDQFGVYSKTPKLGYVHSSINHWRKEFVRGNVHTNTIEGFWSQLKRSIDGTYHSVSPKHLQTYVNEFSFRYNRRSSSAPIFEALVERI